MRISIVLCIINIGLLLLLLPSNIVSAQLKVDFYGKTCPKAEEIVRQVVKKHFSSDPSVPAALLRMHFHDCFVRGCDASILIDSNATSTKTSEKDAIPNSTVRGYELIDEAKKLIEAKCASTVSCADIVTLATRDSVVLAGGPFYQVPTGRLDGLVSNPDEVNLPGPSDSVAQALQAFTAKGLTLGEMVTLLGAHTVGIAHCLFVRGRLSNFQGTGKPDPSMDPVLVKKLLKICGTEFSLPIDKDQTVFLDQNTSFVFDNEFYNQVQRNRGILQIDQILKSDKSTAPFVSKFASKGKEFEKSFVKAMVKMGNLVEGTAGEIRKNCRVFNKRTNSGWASS